MEEITRAAEDDPEPTAAAESHFLHTSFDSVWIKCLSTNLLSVAHKYKVKSLCHSVRRQHPASWICAVCSHSSWQIPQKRAGL